MRCLRLKKGAVHNFLAIVGICSWSQEDIFSKEPVRRMIIAMSTNQSYLGTNRTNQFHYQKFNLNEIVIYRNTSISDQRVYFNTLGALDFFDKVGHGIPLADYPNHFIYAFDLT